MPVVVIIAIPFDAAVPEAARTTKFPAVGATPRTTFKVVIDAAALFAVADWTREIAI